MTEQPKILIVGTQPYNKMVQSRAFDSYFRQFSPNNLAQIFSDSRVPCKGHCEKLFQITDKRLIKRRFSKKIKTGRIFYRQDLNDEWTRDEMNGKKSPKNKGPFYRLLRHLVWNKKFWDTDELERFVEDFKPDYIFVAFSKDFFIFEIALHFSLKYNAPLILSIADDYVFYDEYHNKFLNKWYRKKYLNLINDIMKRNVFCIFESENIKKKYCGEYKIKGEVIYIASSISPLKCSKVDLSKDWYYFGNLEYGRFDSLLAIGKQLNKSQLDIKIHIYSKDSNLYNKKHIPSNVFLHNQVSYEQVIQLSKEKAGMMLIVEGFLERDVQMVKYSLSTKIGDSICLGLPIFAYGHSETGAISFLQSNGIGIISTNDKELEQAIKDIQDGQIDISQFERQYQLAVNYFSVEEQSTKFLSLFKK